MLAVIDETVAGRIPACGTLVIDPVIEGAALPLSGKPAAAGLGVWPRGSVTAVPAGDTLRLFTYWKETAERTDYDLSCLFTTDQFDSLDHLSYTRLTSSYGVHSGDVTAAENGASEFIDVYLPEAGKVYVIPQVYVFCGEGFTEVTEQFFGFMTRDLAQRGAPFEPRAVRMRSPLTGTGRVALPLVFFRGDDGRWYAKWVHLNLKGQPGIFGGTRVEENKPTVELLTRMVMGREYLRAGYITALMKAKAQDVRVLGAAAGELPLEGPVTYVGAGEPDGLPAGSDVITLESLGRLVPA